MDQERQWRLWKWILETMSNVSTTKWIYYFDLNNEINWIIEFNKHGNLHYAGVLLYRRHPIDDFLENLLLPHSVKIHVIVLQDLAPCKEASSHTNSRGCVGQAWNQKFYPILCWQILNITHNKMWLNDLVQET